MTERLAVGAVAEVFVAASTGGFEDDLDLTGVAAERDHWLSFGVELVERTLRVHAMGAAGIEPATSRV